MMTGTTRMDCEGRERDIMAELNNVRHYVNQNDREAAKLAMSCARRKVLDYRKNTGSTYDVEINTALVEVEAQVYQPFIRHRRIEG